jgi:superfamily II DNA/RNA helicase
VYGGVRANPQISALRKGVVIVIACPGRLADHLQSGHVSLDRISITVLDEADHMADLGFLPVVRRLLDQTPDHGQRLLFSATLDRAVDVLVKRYLRNPVTHSVDSAQSPVTSMAHHVLHIEHASRLPVLVDLASAPGRTLIFTRTKHGARLLARKLTAAGAPAVDLHGNLSQNIRAKNLAAFANGTAPTLVATDIAARGIHVDDVALVVHADPPVEHKAYLHRSGRTARAGNAGTVVTLMTDAQKRDVRDLTRKAGVQATITRLDSGHPLLAEIAPGDRVLVTPSPVSERPRSEGGSRGGSGRRHSGGKGRSGGGQASRRNGESRRGDGRGGDSRGGSGHGRPSRGQSAPQGGGQSTGRGAGGQSGSGPTNGRRKPRHTQAKRRTNQRPTPSR